MPIPRPDPLDEHIPALVRMVAKTSWLPNCAVVGKLGRAVFPTSRYNSKRPRFSQIEKNGNVLGMHDDNTTPEWALFWAHGLSGARPTGWTIAHVWPSSNDLGSYTHLANLAMVREPFASLTDKTGPLTAYLRWHAWHAYRWKPECEAEPKMPTGYEAIAWRYLHSVDDPMTLIRERLRTQDNQRIRILRPLMEGMEKR